MSRLVALTAAFVGGSHSFGQSPQPAAATPSAQSGQAALGFDGRDFASVSLGSPIQPADFVVSGTRVWTWNEGGGGETQRIMLQGDTRVELGQYSFSASQAVVWIEPLAELPAAPGAAGEAAMPTDPPRGRYQIAIYFDRVSDPGAPAGLAQSGDRLLVTGVIEGGITLRSDVHRAARPDEPFLREAEMRLARFLSDSVGDTDATGGPDTPVSTSQGGAAARVHARDPIDPGVSRPYEPGSRFAPDTFEPVEGSPAVASQPAPIFARRGMITVAFADRLPDQSVQYIPFGDDEYVAVFDGAVVMVYSDRRSGRTLQVSAQRAVVFTPPPQGGDEPLGGVQSEAGNIRGIYLEGDVIASDGQYTMRGSRVYYDVVGNKASVLDAVFWTYDERRGLPLYVRANSIKQLSDKQWTAEGAKFATTSFFEPHFSLGMTSVTVTQVDRPRDGGERDRPGVARSVGKATGAGGEGNGAGGAGTEGYRRETHVDARGITLRAGGFPFFYVPRFVGDVAHFPLRSVRVDSSSGSGAAIKTTWDVYSLLGLERPEGLEANLLVDGYFDRGAALGADVGWTSPTSQGDLLAYTVINDNGRDHLSSGARLDQVDETRGILLGEHRWNIDETWTLFLEGAYISDETFVDAFFRPLGQSRREFTNSAYLQAIEGTTSFSAQAKGELNDFTPNQYLLQSLGYNTDKLPELFYSRLNDDLIPGIEAGLLTYQSEYRLSRMQLNFTEPTARELGFDTDLRAREAFGLLPDQSLADRLRAQGYTEDAVLRFDTRHELSSPLKAGPVNVTPFVVGRVTGYDTDFDSFSPSENEQIRLWGGGGVRTSTQIIHVDSSVESRFFDIHRIRHIIEPSATTWISGASVNQLDLPVYDDNVESLATGSAIKAGIKQTWQTQRGGPGRWRSVDWITLNTEIVESSSNVARESPIQRFFEYRPEYSLLGDFATVDAVMQISDSLAITANSIYDFETSQPARTSAGGTIQHSQDFNTFAEARYINALNSTLVDFGATYKLTSKYSFSGYLTLDTDINDVQQVAATVRRRFPVATLGVTMRYNNISSETSLGIVLEPAGRQDRASELRRRLGPENRDLPIEYVE
ncbi:MAG: LPS assembly protein LptD [Pyrinomonadaceae bacterium]|nr:LPS assembly protein LptD [Phycisphaerales bacterium]